MAKRNTHDRNVCWVAWEQHRRTTGICKELGIRLHPITHTGARWRRHAILVKRPLGYTLFVDAHNEAVTPYIHKQRMTKFCARRLLRMADVTIVTNRQLSATVAESGGVPFVLPDPIPEVPHYQSRRLSQQFDIAFISTFAEDEPTATVFEAISRFVGRINLYVTGNRDKLRYRYSGEVPPNVTLTGYLSEPDYWELPNWVGASTYGMDDRFVGLMYGVWRRLCRRSTAWRRK